MNWTGRVLAGCLLLAGASLADRAAGARIVSVNLPLPAAHPVTASGWGNFVEAAEKGGRFTFRLFVDGSLLGRGRGLKGLALGEAHMGYVALTAQSAGIAQRVTLGRLALAGPDPMAGAAAMTELVMLHCRRCLESLTRRGIVFLGSHAAGPFHLLSSGPLAQADSLKGVHIASAGPPWDNLVRRLHGQPEPISGGMAASLEEGRIGAVLGPVALLVDPALAGQVRSVTAMHLGIYRVASPFSANLGFWRALTPEERRVLFHAAARGLAAAALAYQDADRKARKAMAAAGIAFSRAHPALVKAAAGFDAEAGTVELLTGRKGAKVLAARFRRLHDKFAGLFAAEQEPSVDSIAGILRREIFDRLDLAAYGLKAAKP